MGEKGMGSSGPVAHSDLWQRLLHQMRKHQATLPFLWASSPAWYPAPPLHPCQSGVSATFGIMEHGDFMSYGLWTSSFFCYEAEWGFAANLCQRIDMSAWDTEKHANTERSSGSVTVLHCLCPQSVLCGGGGVDLESPGIS